MNSETPDNRRVLILGVGNTLLSDDGVGIRIAESLRPLAARYSRIAIVDGGTLGLSLLPEIENASALIVVDAGEIGGAPGDIRVFRNEEMDRHLSGRKSTVHEVAMSDLLAAAELSGRRPAERVLVAIQPASTDWGMAPTPAVSQAMSRARELVGSLARSMLR